MRILLGISRPGYNAATATYCVSESRQSKDILPDLGTAFSMVVGTKLDRQPRQTASAPQPNQMSVVFFFLTLREIEWGAEKISLRSFRQRRKVNNTDLMSSKTWVAHSQFNAIFYRQMSLLPKQHTCAVRSKRIRTDRVCRESAGAGFLARHWLDKKWSKCWPRGSAWISVRITWPWRFTLPLPT